VIAIMFMGSNLGEVIELTMEDEAGAVDRGDTDVLIQSQMRLAIRLAGRASKRHDFDVQILLSVAIETLCANINSFDPAKGRLFTWAWKVMDRGMRKYVSRERKWHGYEQSWIEPYEVSKLGCDYQDELNAMHGAIAQLSPRRQEILRGTIEGKTSTEIAKSLGIARCTVSQIRIRAIAEARAVLASQGGTHD